MIALTRLFAEERPLHGARLAGVRTVRRLVRSGNAAVLGWPRGRLPLGSTVLGSQHIAVGPGFDSALPVWIEAVTEYAGVRHHPAIRIGARFTTSGRLHMSAIDCIEIGDDCLFGSNVYVGDHSHGALAGADASAPGVAPRDRPLAGGGPIVIGQRVWLGDNVVVLAGVSIGDGAIVGANSVVTRDVPAGSVAVGAPAAPIRHWDDRAAEWVRFEEVPVA